MIVKCNCRMHDILPEHYPLKNTFGVVLDVSDDNTIYKVLWDEPRMRITRISAENVLVVDEKEPTPAQLKAENFQLRRKIEYLEALLKNAHKN